MSFKGKDLTYGRSGLRADLLDLTLLIDNAQPAFLRRLRGELAGDDSARHEQPIPRNKRLKQDDEEDAPTYVLEDTNESITKEENEACQTVFWRRRGMSSFAERSQHLTQASSLSINLDCVSCTQLKGKPNALQQQIIFSSSQVFAAKQWEGFVDWMAICVVKR